MLPWSSSSSWSFVPSSGSRRRLSIREDVDAERVRVVDFERDRVVDTERDPRLSFGIRRLCLFFENS